MLYRLSGLDPVRKVALESSIKTGVALKKCQPPAIPHCRVNLMDASNYFIASSIRHQSETVKD